MKPKTIEFTISENGEIEANIDLGPDCCFEQEQELLDAMAEEGIETKRLSTFCKIKEALKPNASS